MKRLLAVLLFAAALPFVAACSLVPARATAPQSMDPYSSPTARAASDVGAGPSRFTGTFMADDRPSYLHYLSLTQTGDMVNGYMIQVQPDQMGSTQGENISVHGNVDKDAVTLMAKSFLELANVTMTGRRDGEQVILTYPTNSGTVASLVFVPASQNKFNEVVSVWQKQLADTYQQQLDSPRTVSDVYVGALNADITVRENGDFEVEETRETVFPSSREFKHGYREIPLVRVEDIGAVEVSEDGKQYQSGRETPYTFDVSKTSDNLRIDWWYPPTSGKTRAFTIRYVVTGGLYIYDDGDQLYWKAIESDRSYPIGAATVSVHLPQDVESANLKIASYDAKAGSEVVDPRTVTFTTGEIAAGSGLEIRVQFPHGLVQGHVTEWQKARDHNM